MPARYWLLPLFAVALLAFAAHEPARADQAQFVVTYVEFLERLARLGRNSTGAISFTANQQIQRPNFFVLLEIWKDAKSRQDFEERPQTKALLNQIQPLLEVPFDERPGTLVE